MKRIDNITLLIIAIFLVFAFIFGLDLETARRDYEQNGFAEGCLFEVNCKRYE